MSSAVFEIDPLSDERRRLKSCYVSPEGVFRARLSAAEVADAFREGEGTLWVDIDSRSDEAFALLAEVFRFHPLAIEDTRVPDTRVKLEEYEGMLFLVARGLRFALETVEPYDITTSNRYFFLGPNFLVSVHEGVSTSADAVARRIAAEPDLLRRGPDHVLYMFLDQMIDRYFPVCDQVDEFIDELEDELLEQNGGGEELIPRVLALKRTLITLRRQLAAQRELLLALTSRPGALLQSDTRLYLRDVYDHTVRQLDLVESFRDLLSSLTETHFTMVSNRMNEVIKALSVIATIVLPPTLIASIYGMNFDAIPLAGEPHGFWMAVALMLLISVGFLLYLKRKEWL